MQKTYVLDTNVLIQSPHALLAFEENKIVLPIAVLEDLDKIKTRMVIVVPMQDNPFDFWSN